jgi:hypothetical protein
VHLLQNNQLAVKQWKISFRTMEAIIWNNDVSTPSTRRAKGAGHDSGSGEGDDIGGRSGHIVLDGAIL